MDPNAALENILHGHMIADHAEALEDWLAKGGFAPNERALEASRYPLHQNLAGFVYAHCARHYPGVDHYMIQVRANRFGLWTSGPNLDRAKFDGPQPLLLRKPWISLATFAELKRMSE